MPTLRPPPLSGLLVSHDSTDVAWSAPSIEGPSLGAEIPVLFPDGLALAAQLAGLPPLTIAPHAAAMQPFVWGCCEEFQVVRSIVELVAVSMMDEIPGRDGSVEGLPHQHMLHTEPSLARIVDPMVAFLSDATVSSGSVRLRTSFTHDAGA